MNGTRLYWKAGGTLISNKEFVVFDDVAIPDLVDTRFRKRVVEFAPENQELGGAGSISIYG
jgi:hypothetical protein